MTGQAVQGIAKLQFAGPAKQLLPGDGVVEQAVQIRAGDRAHLAAVVESGVGPVQQRLAAVAGSHAAVDLVSADQLVGEPSIPWADVLYPSDHPHLPGKMSSMMAGCPPVSSNSSSATRPVEAAAVGGA